MWVVRGARRPGVALSAVLAVTLLAACQAGNGAATAGGRGANQSPTPAPSLVIPSPVSFQTPLKVTVDSGSLAAMQVSQHGTGTTLPGAVDGGGTAWVSSIPPVAGETYDVVATLRSTQGKTQPTTSSFTVATIPTDQRLRLTMYPNEGDVVGVGAPIVIRFDQKVTDRSAVESSFQVSSTTPVVGSWHWVNDREVHFRPEQYWPTGTKVAVHLGLNGVQAGPDLWGARTYELGFTVGDSHIAYVDAAKHTLTPIVNGKAIGVWPTSLGRPEFATRNGTYVVLSKDRSLRMTSCSAQITCDKSNPNYYDLTVDFDVRLTWSGTFVHSAPWSVDNQGFANVSHGCVNLSAAHGQIFFDQSRYGDVVIVKNSSRPATDLVRSGDPGMADWNMSWSQYVAASALKQEVTTTPLATQQG